MSEASCATRCQSNTFACSRQASTSRKSALCWVSRPTRSRHRHRRTRTLSGKAWRSPGGNRNRHRGAQVATAIVSARARGGRPDSRGYQLEPSHGDVLEDLTACAHVQDNHWAFARTGRTARDGCEGAKLTETPLATHSDDLQDKGAKHSCASAEKHKTSTLLSMRPSNSGAPAEGCTKHTSTSSSPSVGCYFRFCAASFSRSDPAVYAAESI